MLLLIAVVLLALWALGFLAFHAGALIHIVLIAAVVIVIWHFVRGTMRLR